MAQALSGIRVIDMTSVVMGPSATMVLGDHGADVIKIETGGGDTTRRQPPKKSEDMGCSFLKLNRNKRSVVLDLKQADQMEVLHRLIETADILIYSIRPQAMARLGLTPESLKALNPRLITISLVGFGRDGPYAGKPVYEDLIQGATAIPSLLVKAGSEHPHYVPVSFNDRATGLYAVIAVTTALFHREKTGIAQHIEVPMFESMAQFALGDHIGGRAFVPPIAPMGYARTLTKERRPFPTKDGHICVIVYTDGHWRAFAKVLGRPDLMEKDERFKDFTNRTIHADHCFEVVRQAMAGKTTAEWLAILEEADIPAGPLNTLESLFDDPHLAATGFFVETDHPTEGRVLNMLGPSTWSETPPQIRRHAPKLGEHTREVILELGYSEDQAEKISAGRSADG
ncbi:MAG: CoA transferase [Alphaproteobacteria bacterium]|nr:CoA transferase [Alphaproteobacteria bacterium]MDB5720291.1 CoA transferase [Alphaproteobacteria bacterium]